MKKKVIAGSLALLAVTAMHAQTYQLPNVGFKDWKGKCDATFFTEIAAGTQTLLAMSLLLGILLTFNLVLIKQKP